MICQHLLQWFLVCFTAFHHATKIRNDWRWVGDNTQRTSIATCRTNNLDFCAMPDVTQLHWAIPCEEDRKNHGRFHFRSCLWVFPKKPVEASNDNSFFFKVANWSLRSPSFMTEISLHRGSLKFNSFNWYKIVGTNGSSSDVDQEAYRSMWHLKPYIFRKINKSISITFLIVAKIQATFVSSRFFVTRLSRSEDPHLVCLFLFFRLLAVATDTGAFALKPASAALPLRGPKQ